MTDIKSRKSDRSLLKQLNTKSKPNITKISSDLNLSPQTIKNRLGQLKEEKIISNSDDIIETYDEIVKSSTYLNLLNELRLIKKRS